MRVPALVRKAAVEGWNEAAARSGTPGGAAGGRPGAAGGRPGAAGGRPGWAADAAEAGGGSWDTSAGQTERRSLERLMLSSRSMLLVERAQALAAGGREDAAAVEELAGLGDGDAAALRSAAGWFQESAWNLESRQADRAYRLLTAAVRGDQVRPVAPAAAARFARLEALAHSSLGEAFEQLCALEPRLESAADDARRGRLGPAVSGPGAEWLAAEERLRIRLNLLVGPGASSSDWLVGTAAAYRIAADYIRRLKPG